MGQRILLKESDKYARFGWVTPEPCIMTRRITHLRRPRGVGRDSPSLKSYARLFGRWWTDKQPIDGLHTDLKHSFYSHEWLDDFVTRREDGVIGEVELCGSQRKDQPRTQSNGTIHRDTYAQWLSARAIARAWRKSKLKSPPHNRRLIVRGYDFHYDVWGWHGLRTISIHSLYGGTAAEAQIVMIFLWESV